MTSKQELSVMVHGAAGALSSVAALALLYPLDQLRMLQQLDLAPKCCEDEKLRERLGERLGSLVELVKREGVHGMYRGLTPSLLTLAISNFVFYYTFHWLKRVADRLRTSKARFGTAVVTREASLQRSTIENLVTSALAGILNVILTNPLWLATTVMKRGQQKDAPKPPPSSHQQENHACKRQGNEQCLCPATPYMASLYGSNDTKHDCDKSGDVMGNTYLELVYAGHMAGIAGVQERPTNKAAAAAAATAAKEDDGLSSTSPQSSYVSSLYGGTGAREASKAPNVLDACVRVTPLSHSDDAKKQKPVAGIYGLVTLLLHIRREKGIVHLWKGTVASLVLVSNPIIQFAVYEGLKRVIIMRFHGRRGNRGTAVRSQRRRGQSYSLSAMEGFFLGAFAKGIATFATYPLQVAQARLRSSSSAPQRRHQRSNQPEREEASSTEAQGAQRAAKDYPDPTSTTAACLASIYRSGGVTALYDGLLTKVTQSVATSAFMFASYESILGTMVKISQQQQ